MRDTGDFDSHDSLLREDELPNTIALDEPESSPHCSCISAGAFDQGFLTESALGYDMTNSCYGDISILICKACARHWLHLLIEDEAITSSGRWYRGIITPELGARMSAELAVPYLSRLEWYWRGGSYFKGIVSKGSGKLRS